MEWVRHDLLDAGWRWRILLRVCVQLVVPFVVFLVLPGLDVLARVLLELLMVLAALMTVAIASDQVRERRLRQHRLPVPEDRDGPPGPVYRY